MPFCASGESVVDNDPEVLLNQGMTNTATAAKLFKDMTDAELREAHSNWYSLMRSASNGRMARSMGRCLRNVEIIEAIARKRGVRL